MINGVVNQITELSNGNPIIAGAISLWLLGCATYLAKSIPAKIYEFMVKHLTTELVTTSQNEVFHNLLTWLEKNGYAAKFRKIKLSNGRFGWRDDGGATKSVGYGSHLVWYCGRPVLISLNKEETKSEFDKETISLVKLGRSHKIFDKLIDEIADKESDKTKTKVHRYAKGWDFIGLQPKRNIDSVILDADKKDLLIKTLDDFVEAESWYIKHGIPYQLGILLYGPPGTGKTSLIRAIAAHSDRALCIANFGFGGNLDEVLHTSPEDSLVVLEDIDTSSVVKKRKDAEELNRMTSLEMDMSGATLSDVLNAIDGVVSRHGRILIMTTNHIDKIDEALLRPGRVDLKMEIGYLNEATFEAMVREFYEDIPEDYFKGRKLKERKLTGAIIQGDIRSKMSYEDIIKKYWEKKND